MRIKGKFMVKSSIKTFLLVLLSVCMLPAQVLFAEASDFHFAVEADATVRFAEQGEYVFMTIGSGVRRTLSYLEWEQKPLFVPKAKVTAGWKNLYLSASARAALPTRCGSVFDSDWMNVTRFPNCADEYAHIKTNYTESDCKTNYYYEFGGELSYKFKVTDKFAFSPTAEISYVHSYFSAIGGSGSYYNSNQYEPNGYYGYYNDEENSHDVEISGEALSLERVIFTAWLGGRFDMGITPKVNMGFSFAVNLWTFAQSLDSHLLTGAYYLDEFDDYFGGLKAGVDFSYNATKKDTLIFAAQWLGLKTLEGTTKSTTIENASYDDYMDCSYWENGTFHKCTSGFDINSIEFTIGYRHTFN